MSETRRSVSLSNVEELTPVPLIVKAPGQRRGRISDAYARTLDVTPTIADVLGLPLGYRADGSSAFGREARRRSAWCAWTRATSAPWYGSPGAAGRRAGAAWSAGAYGQFGSGATGLYTGIGPHRSLLGQRPSALARAARGGRQRDDRRRRPSCAT